MYIYARNIFSQWLIITTTIEMSAFMVTQDLVWRAKDTPSDFFIAFFIIILMMIKHGKYEKLKRRN